jgi:hypothetical protein
MGANSQAEKSYHINYHTYLWARTNVKTRKVNKFPYDRLEDANRATIKVHLRASMSLPSGGAAKAYQTNCSR